MMTYQQQIKHPDWQRKRLEVLEINDYQCQMCAAKDQTLHVHHPYYRRGAMIWEYETVDLMCLCHKCHKETHAIDERIKKSLSFLGAETKMQILGYIHSMSMSVPQESDENYDYGFADGVRGNTHYLIASIKRAWGK